MSRGYVHIYIIIERREETKKLTIQNRRLPHRRNAA